MKKKTSNNEKNIKMIKILLILCVILFSAHATPAKTKSMRFRRKSQPAYTNGLGQQWVTVGKEWEKLKSLSLGPKATETSSAAVRQFMGLNVQPTYVLFCSNAHSRLFHKLSIFILSKPSNNRLLEQTKTECPTHTSIVATLPAQLDQLAVFAEANSAMIVASTTCPAGPIPTNPIDYCGFIRSLDDMFGKLQSCPLSR